MVEVWYFLDLRLGGGHIMELEPDIGEAGQGREPRQVRPFPFQDWPAQAAYNLPSCVRSWASALVLQRPGGKRPAGWTGTL